MFGRPSPLVVAGVQAVRQTLKDAFATWQEDWDAVLAPISPVVPFPHQQGGTTAERTIDVDGRRVPYLHMLNWTALATALHLPALAVPAGHTSTGLPIGTQLIGGRHDEHRLLDLATALEGATAIRAVAGPR